MTLPSPDKSPAHHLGHRERLRERFARGGPDAMEDYEMLELLLCMAIPRGDVKPQAKALIKRHGTLAGVLNAPLTALEDAVGVGRASAIALKIVQAAAQRLLKQDIIDRPILNSWSRLLGYCQAAMAHEPIEQFRILFLNKKNELIADEVQQRGTVDHTPAYPREIMKRALELGATALILAHNHPSGDPAPSQADIEMTDAIRAAGEPFDIVIHDHLIIARRGVSSFKTLGLL